MNTYKFQTNKIRQDYTSGRAHLWAWAHLGTRPRLCLHCRSHSGQQFFLSTHFWGAAPPPPHLHGWSGSEPLCHGWGCRWAGLCSTEKLWANSCHTRRHFRQTASQAWVDAAGAGEVAQWGKCSPYKHEGLSLDLQWPCKKPGVVVHVWNPCT